MNVAVPVWLFWTLIACLFIFLGGALFIWYYYWKKERTDKILMFDKNMRWRLMPYNIKGYDRFNLGAKTYFFKENEGFLNNKGKNLYIFNENNSAPLHIEKYKSQWLNPESLKGIINNSLVQMMMKTKDEFRDTILLFGAIGGMIAGLSSGVILLIQVGVI